MKKEDKAVKNVQNELRKKDKELKYLRAKAAYWEMYAQIQDEEIKKRKKKLQLNLSNDVSNKDTT